MFPALLRWQRCFGLAQHFSSCPPACLGWGWGRLPPPGPLPEQGGGDSWAMWDAVRHRVPLSKCGPLPPEVQEAALPGDQVLRGS